MPSSAPMTMEEPTAPSPPAGQNVRDGEVEIRGVVTRVWRNAPAGLRAIPRALALSRRAGTLSSTRMSGRPSKRATANRPPAGAVRSRSVSAWRRATGFDRDAQPSRVGHGLLGHHRAGAVAVPLNAWWTGPELQYGLHDSGDAVAFVDGRASGPPAPHSTTPHPAGRGGHERRSKRPRRPPSVVGAGDHLRRAGGRRRTGSATGDVTLPMSR